MKLHNVYFSAKGTTKSCAEYIEKGLGLEAKRYDWFSCPCSEPLEIPGEDVLLFSMPVYGGFIPHICAAMAKNLKGDNTPAIITAVYGNRHYDNALLQVKDILTGQGFFVIAAGAFLAEHSIFPSVASGRPDEEDKAAMRRFAEKCGALLQEKNIREAEEICLPGTPGYDAAAFQGVPFKPDGDETCTGCGKCADICPQKAIDRENPRQTSGALCISCGGCIRACPVGARNYHSEVYEKAREGFEEKCSVYRKPEAFYIVMPESC